MELNALLWFSMGAKILAHRFEMERTTLPTNVPTVEETRESNAFTWVIVLLVVGTIVPMATWWVFSR
jgi:hypothetical protein